ncbi:MAG: tetratricopeptide repeat protein [Planctomycetes bacterium]|nr:tetratricopeptide repeat protein [Planctomycetota bacterium]
MNDLSKRLVTRINALVLVCFFLSGVTGLIYEILWTRMIVKIIGSAPFAISIILTIFMGGLGIGSYISSLTIDRIKRPLHLVRLYGILELVIGLYVLMIPLLLVLFKPVSVLLYNRFYDSFLLYNGLTFVGCFVLLCIPVICMGATLPILCKFYVHTLSNVGKKSSRLYGLNTIGAAVGSLLCGFWFLKFFGMQGTLFLAVSINVLISVVCLAVSFKVKPPLLDVEMPEALALGDVDTIQRSPYPSIVIIFVLLTFAVSGFCSMAYEVIWTSLLGLIVGPTTYSFTIVLITFITGLALGCMLFGYLADKTKMPVCLLIITQIGAALFALYCSELLGGSQLLFAKLLHSTQNLFVIQSILKALFLFGFMILPTLCLGATFPLVSKIYTSNIDKIGKSIGFAYSINTIGAVLGSFCAGFVLSPLFGKEKALSLVVSLQLVCALILTFVILIKRKKLRYALFMVPAVIGLLLCLKFPAWDHHQLSVGKYHRFDEIRLEIKNTGWVDALFNGKDILAKHKKGELVYYGDGIGGFTAVLEYAQPIGGSNFSLTVSGKPDASNNNDMATQTSLANFPMLFHPKAEKVMVLGFASGVTAGEILNYPISQLDILEINRQTVEASAFFLPWNNDVLSSEKTNLIIQDGRAHLELTEESYDVIISEPSNPWMSGLASLFTKDFFELAKSKLNSNGMFVQWLHIYQLDWPTVQLIGRTFTEVFPNSILTLAQPKPAGTDYLLVGFKDDNLIKVENAVKNFPYAQQSDNIKLLDHRLFYRMIVAENLVELFGEGRVHSDDMPILEFSAPRLMYRQDKSIVREILSKGVLSESTREITRFLKSDIDSQINYAAYAFSVNAPFRNMVDLSGASSAQQERFYVLAEDFSKKGPFDFDFFNNKELKQRCIGTQLKIVSENIESMADKSMSYRLLGDLYRDSSLADKAIESYYMSIEIKKANPEANYMLGVVFCEKGKMDLAEEYFQKAVELDPLMAMNAYGTLGSFLLKNKMYEKSFIQFAKYLQLESGNALIHNQQGINYMNLGRLDEAKRHFSEALRLKPGFRNAYKNLQHIRTLESRSQSAWPQEN